MHPQQHPTHHDPAAQQQQWYPETQWGQQPPGGPGYEYEPGSGRGGNLRIGISLAVIVVLTIVAAALLWPKGDAAPAKATAESVTGMLAGVGEGEITVMTPLGQHRTLPVKAGPDTEPAQLAALQAAHRTVRARVVDGKVTSVVVVPPPGKLTSQPGSVERAGDGEIVLRVGDTLETYSIAEKDLAAMDIPHMLEHRQAGAQVILRYDEVDGKRFARSFADASAPNHSMSGGGHGQAG